MERFNGETKEERSTTSLAAGTLLCISILLSILCTPLIMKHVLGLKKILIAFQQLCVILYLSIVVLNQNLSTYIASLASLSTGNITYSILTARDIQNFGKSLSTFFLDFFRWEYYFLSLLQSLDVYVLICKPFRYNDFANNFKVLKMVSLGALACFIFSIDHIIVLLVNAFYLAENEREILTKDDILRWLSYADIGKHVGLKVAYSVAVIKMALSIRKCLSDSSKLTDKSKSLNLHQRLFRFTLIPLSLNFLYATHEGLDIYNIICKYSDYVRKYKTFQPGMFIKPDIIACLTATNIFMGTLIYVIGYFSLFSELRKICSRSKDE